MVPDSQGTGDVDGREGSSATVPHSKPDADRANPVPGRPASGELDARQSRRSLCTSPTQTRPRSPRRSACPRRPSRGGFRTKSSWRNTFVSSERSKSSSWAQMVATKNEAWERFKNLMAHPNPRISLRATPGSWTDSSPLLRSSAGWRHATPVSVPISSSENGNSCHWLARSGEATPIAHPLMLRATTKTRTMFRKPAKVMTLVR